MTAVQGLAGVLWIGVIAYALFGGADFGGGFWDLTAGSAQSGATTRARISHSMGPVWEANHVWLIFALVVLWTGFPAVFASLASTLFIPFTLVAFGVILRGSAFAFRKETKEIALMRVFGATFASSSIATPFFLGTMAGAIASGRIPLGVDKGNIITAWLNPFSIYAGILAVGTTAWLAAVFLAADAHRDREVELCEAFRRKGLGSGLAVGAFTFLGIALVRSQAPLLYHGLVTKALWVVGLSALAGVVSIALLYRRQYQYLRITGSLAVVTVFVGWAVAQYPHMLVGGPTLNQAAAPVPIPGDMLWALALGGALIIPSLAWLYFLFAGQKQST